MKLLFCAGYQHPPPAVHHVMMASLLLLGHWEEETEVNLFLVGLIWEQNDLVLVLDRIIEFITIHDIVVLSFHCIL